MALTVGAFGSLLVLANCGGVPGLPGEAGEGVDRDASGWLDGGFGWLVLCSARGRAFGDLKAGLP